MTEKSASKLESYTYYRGYQIRYDKTTFTTTVEFGGELETTFHDRDEETGIKYAKEFIDKRIANSKKDGYMRSIAEVRKLADKYLAKDVSKHDFMRMLRRIEDYCI